MLVDGKDSELGYLHFLLVRLIRDFTSVSCFCSQVYRTFGRFQIREDVQWKCSYHFSKLSSVGSRSIYTALLNSILRPRSAKPYDLRIPRHISLICEVSLLNLLQVPNILLPFCSYSLGYDRIRRECEVMRVRCGGIHLGACVDGTPGEAYSLCESLKGFGCFIWLITWIDR